MKFRYRIVRGLALLAVGALLLSGCAAGKGGEESIPATEAPAAVTEAPAVPETQPVTEPARPVLTVESVEEGDGEMVVTTSYCVVKYPFAFSDILRVTAENQEDQAALLFGAWLEGAEYPMFRILFNNGEGMPLGQLVRYDGEVLNMTVQFYQADEAMAPELMQTFYAAQETVNEVIASLAENDNFTPAA